MSQTSQMKRLAQTLSEKEVELNKLQCEASDLREETIRQRIEIEGLECRLEAAENVLASRFKDCRTLNDVFNLFDTMEGRALAAEEQLVHSRQEQERLQAANAQLAEQLLQFCQRADMLRRGYKPITTAEEPEPRRTPWYFVLGLVGLAYAGVDLSERTGHMAWFALTGAALTVLVRLRFRGLSRKTADLSSEASGSDSAGRG